MQVPPTVVIRMEGPTAALEARVREAAAKLERFHARIVSCRVVVEEANRNQRTGRRYEVRVDVRVPGRNEIVATGSSDDDAMVAVRDAFAAATRQLEDATRERRP